ncbi:ABC transporter B family member 9 [Ziziphus jujuba]|uniref:ABC transporter B family member 9 n=1 Tax=Ziziphus jujuba TaxID=326968 RepID=A0ABM4A979_ZIZJJ|nr:ABC transporter B family member 9 [Ziziphus jujuba]
MEGVAEDEGRKQPQQDVKVPIYKLFAFADSLDMVLMVIGTISAIGNGMSQPLSSVLFGELITSIGSSETSQILDQVSKVVLDFVYLAIGSGIASFLQVSCWMVTGERQASRIRALYLKTILRQDIAFFDTDTKAGEFIGRMSGNIILIQDAMGEKIGKFIQNISTVLGGFIIAFAKGWVLALVLLSCIPCLAIAIATMVIVMMKTSNRGQLAYAEAGNVVEQIVGAIRTVASFTGEKQAIDKYNKKLEVAYKMSAKQGLATGLANGCFLVIFHGTYSLAIWYGSKLIIEKGYNGGTVINVMFAIMAGGLALGDISPSLNALSSGQAAAYKMLETIKRKPKIDVYDTNGIVLEDIEGEIEIKDVHFRYPARPDVEIFAGLSLQVPSGKTAALVGESGSGKSTVISLLERFYDPNAGEVYIDGIDLRKFQLKWIREKIGLVSQEPILFATSIKENIAYGKENATDEEIRTSTKLANAAKFIDKLPKGLETLAGDKGTQLSGGQKQRIAIARAILKNPRILLLDEATSSLDTESERIVQDALVRVMQNRTTVVVAHRLRTIRNADIIAVLHQGKLVEQGTHDELVKDPEGAYSQLVSLQEGAYETEDIQASIVHERNTSFDMENNTMVRSGNQRLSLRSSISTGSIGDEESIIRSKFDPQKKRSIPIKRLAYLNKPEAPALLVGTIAAGIQGVMPAVFGLLLANSFEMFFKPPHQLRKDSKFWSLMFLVLGCIALVLAPIKNFFFGVAGARLIQRICLLTFKKVVHQEICWFDDPTNSSGAIGARLSLDASTMKILVGDALSLLVQSTATVMAALTIAFTANWILAFIVLLVSPILLIQGYIQKRILRGLGADAKAMYEEASQVANDAVGSIRTVASFCSESRVMEIYQKKCEATMKQEVKSGLVGGVGYGVSSFSLYCMQGLIFYVGAVLEKHGKATFGEVLKVFYALAISAIVASQNSGMANNINKAKDSAVSIFGILDQKPKIDSSSNQGTTLPSIVGNIEFEHVSFKYPTRPDIQIFKDLCLNIPSGKTVALVGESGSGKSTTISLIQRFYDPDSGRVKLDGIDIRKFRLNWLRHQMGLVSQEPILFNETIRANIAYGKQGDIVTEEEIIAAAKSANAHNFISCLPHSYETSVGERGVQLSGGQKQRIAIARAIVKNPKIFLLDEATSALDAESERVVQDALDSVMVSRTTVVVAHRLTTIKEADIIAVFKDGVVVEKGTHENLMKINDGAYRSLVALHMNST